MPAPESSVENLRDAIERHSGTVDRSLEAFIDGVPGQVPNLAEGLRYALGLDQPDPKTRGKRLRPVLCLLTAEALGADPRDALPFAVAIELMHNFALVHDDIEDGDTMRRNRPAVWKRYGLAHGINIGDYLLVQVARALLQVEPERLDAELRLRLTDLMTETLDHTHVGQALDINARGRAGFAMADYERIVREKTGHYLAAPMLGGAMVAGESAETCRRLEAFGLAIGPMFQILDDIIDLTRGKGRGEIGNDLREGKRSFMVAWTAERADAAERAELFRILDVPREETTPQMIEAAVELFRRHGAIEAGHRRASQLREEGLAALEGLPDRLQGMLAAFSRMLLERQT